MFFQRDHVRKGDQYYRKGNLEQAAHHYLKAKRFRQAAKIYEELGKIDKAVQIYEGQDQSLEAAELLEAQGQLKKAIAFFEKDGSFRRAAEASLKLRNYVRAGRLFEKAGMHGRAAECFQKGNDLESVVRALETQVRELRANLGGSNDLTIEKNIRKVDTRRAEVLVSVGRYLEAAEVLNEHDAVERAAPLFERAGRFGEAAGTYLAAGLFDEALNALEQVRGSDRIDEELRAEIYLNCGRHAEAAQLFEGMGRFDAAASAYADAGDWGAAGGMWAEAGAAGRAADAFQRAGRHRESAESYRLAGRILEAGELFIEAGDDGSAREVFSALAEDSAEFGPASLRLIPLLVDDGAMEEAQRRWQLLQDRGDPISSSDKLYIEGRILEATGEYRRAESLYRRILAEHHGFRDVAQRLREVRGKVSISSSSLESASRSKPSDAEDSAAGTGSLQELSSIELSDEEAELLSTTDPLVPPDPLVRPEETSSANEEPPSPSAAADTGSMLPITALADASELPFDFGDELEPWWQGAVFFRARDRRHDREVFLVSFPLAVVGGRPEGFRQAMRQVSAIRHPTILRLDDAILASDKVLLIYEPFSERTLGNRLAEHHLPPATALSLVAQLCEALATAHKLGVIHQWISPRTVLIDDHGAIRLVGLGLRDILADRDEISRAYLSPEVREAGVIGPTSDVYSLGLLAAELLRAQMPVGWEDSGALDAADIEWPEDVEQAVASSVRDVLLRALAREPLARPSTEELKQVLSTLGLAPGQVLAGRYRIVGELGRGGMSRVYRALDQEFDDEVAIKTVLTPAFGPAEDEERLLREVRICRKISHPNVVRVHDIGRFPGGIFVIMEILEGPGLDQVIADDAPLALARIKKILLQIAGALSEAHRAKIVHRDLKPSNVMLVDGRVKVLDFGIARMADGSTGHLTQTGQVIGSPMYMAPEQIQGLPLAGTCDLYALGVIAFTLLAGREPFTGETTTSIALKHLHETPPDILEFRPDLPGPWVELLSELLAKKPEDRVQSAEDVSAALTDLSEG